MKTVQRIKLRAEGSPVKWDATITAATADGKEIRVRFDGPMADTTLYAIGDRRMASDMKDRSGAPVEDWRAAASSMLWEVI